MLFLLGREIAKKMITTLRKPPHSLSIKTWTIALLDGIYLEHSSARINGASEKTLNFWHHLSVYTL